MHCYYIKCYAINNIVNTNLNMMICTLAFRRFFCILSKHRKGTTFASNSRRLSLSTLTINRIVRPLSQSKNINPWIQSSKHDFDTFHVTSFVRQISNQTHQNESLSKKIQTNEESEESLYKDAEKLTGEECYIKATEFLNQAKILRRHREDEYAKEQYEAMIQNTTQTETKTGVTPTTSQANRKAGIAVVQTIVKQTKSMKQSKNDEILQNISYYENEAQRYMQYAALIHLNKEALVRLGNEALKEAQESNNDGDMTFGQNMSTPINKSYLYPYIINDHNKIVNHIRLHYNSNPLDRAIYLYSLAGKAGSSEAWYNLGNLYWNGFGMDHICSDDCKHDNEKIPNNQLEPDAKEALKSFHEAINLGDSDAMYFVGVQYLSIDTSDIQFLQNIIPSHVMMEDPNMNQTKIRNQGLAFVKEAALTHHHGGALYYLALLNRSGDKELNIPISNDEFRSLLDKAAKEKDSDALFVRAHCLYNGEDGYTQNYRDALDEFIAAGEAGNPDGFVSAGAMLHTGGYGGTIERDQRRAFELYQEAAEMGSEDGWRNVVACYVSGEGVPKCEKTAEYIVKTVLKDR